MKFTTVQVFTPLFRKSWSEKYQVRIFSIIAGTDLGYTGLFGGPLWGSCEMHTKHDFHHDEGGYQYILQENMIEKFLNLVFFNLVYTHFSLLCRWLLFWHFSDNNNGLKAQICCTLELSDLSTSLWIWLNLSGFNEEGSDELIAYPYLVPIKFILR